MLASTLRRSMMAAARPMARPTGVRAFSRSSMALSAKVTTQEKQTVSKSLDDVDGEASLFGEGGKPNTIPTDFEQATGLERLEYLGKLKGIEIFDDQPLDASRRGTIEDPIIIDSYDHERYVGCTGSPAGSHEVQWLRPSTHKVGRCWECGSVYKLNYIGTESEHHH
ncbi:cytochrome c oxidase subunit IV [Sugiyamaella lignohabitans]|uniref:Cytochrome c oxidase subunit 4, mitochondrial n=1 Tax=Sugiyamaella lignohabitans TaxID=796027 RepID=A0A167FBI1_9ASCO|nr:cytochrome c oxidase subunit IV [Sugiyamaella lignohabitans]ANB15072.1 cytochrome c oxidase subunit IV [Sugiyamaella lignohabitans]